MKEIIKRSLRGLLVVPVLVLAFGFVAAPASVSALSLREGADSARGDDQQGNAGCLFGTESNCSGDGIFKTVTNILLFIIGAIAVIMLVIGGIRYTTSNGDSNSVTAAKNTIMYAIIGIIVAILAYAVVNFVIDSLV